MGGTEEQLYQPDIQHFPWQEVNGLAGFVEFIEATVGDLDREQLGESIKVTYLPESNSYLFYRNVHGARPEPNGMSSELSHEELLSQVGATIQIIRRSGEPLSFTVNGYQSFPEEEFTAWIARVINDTYEKLANNSNGFFPHFKIFRSSGRFKSTGNEPIVDLTAKVNDDIIVPKYKKWIGRNVLEGLEPD